MFYTQKSVLDFAFELFGRDKNDSIGIKLTEEEISRLNYELKGIRIIQRNAPGFQMKTIVEVTSKPANEIVIRDDNGHDVIIA